MLQSERQSHLVECENCNRTFLPDRLQVHLRSCRSPPEGTKPRSVLSTPQKPREDEVAPPTPSPRPRRPIVPCYVCGREFGSKSIGIHEPQCLSKWRAENEKLAPQQRRPEPKKPGESNQEPAMQTSPSPVSPRPAQGQPSRPPTVPCYLCGRQFGTKSIAIHEPQCLKKWRSENEKLPPERRRPEPQKPEMRFKENGQVDCEATFEAIWETHLQQLVPCKTCGRTFFPDRIEIHERSCKGQVKK
ncbi:hypothetical protein J437_LFUL002063 [Ladona fulva]|uniref:C2HC/C3H-type domain-containing protein n=1 Tax=Ladona fulva TaxID=123851 RepID=A0A8K0NXP4_LADFU|nr:hypothetical protein J437_LFUL002063 [Ladona fulva]